MSNDLGTFVPSAPLQSQPILNSVFLTEIFKNLSPEFCAWVCVFPGDPSAGRWTGFGLQPENFSILDSMVARAQRLNAFTTFSSFRGQPGASKDELLFPGRRGALFAGMHAVMLDDLGAGPGAKLPLEEHLVKLRPSWILETSPQNYQIGFLFREPIREKAMATAFIDALIYQGLAAEDDPGMAGVTRYGRLPAGWNGKAKYGPEGFHHRLVHWEPERRYRPREVLDAFGIDWERVASVADKPAGSRLNGADAAPEEQAWMDLFAKAVGRFEGPNDKGSAGVWYDCTCPWLGEHTGGEDSGSAYCLGGGFECHHGHCRDRTWNDVRRWLLNHGTVEIAREATNLVGHEAFGLELVDAPARAAGAREEPVFDRARALTSRFDQDTSPQEISRGIDRIAQWSVAGGLDEVELSALKKDIVDATYLTKGDVNEALKISARQERLRRNVETVQQALVESAGKTCPTIPLIAPSAFPLKIGDSDTPALVTGNVQHILRAVGVSVRYNEMRQRKEYEGPFRDWSLDWAASWLRDACTLNGLMGANEVNLKRMTDKLAEEHGYHPFVEWLDTLEWDGVSRLQDLYATITVARNKVRLRDLILRRWLCSTVAAARHLHADEPGLQPRGLVVFTGSQHQGKSTWFSRLFYRLFPRSNECFVGNASYTGDKDSKMLNLRSLVIEWGELETTFSRTHLGALKAFINQSVDSFRKPFGAEVSDIPRRSVYCATLNRQDFLRDATGNSRYWTLSPLGIDLDAQRRLDMAQVWAEVDRIVAFETAEAQATGSHNRPWLMTREEIEYIERHNQGHRDRTDTEIWLEELFRWDDPDWARATPAERLETNPMRLGDVAALVGISRRGYGRNLSELKIILQEFTGQKAPVHTTKNIAGNRVNAKFWGMPPLVDAPSDQPPKNFLPASLHTH